eukprot:288178-Prorocentrum_minimum.AAC.1
MWGEQSRQVAVARGQQLCAQLEGALHENRRLLEEVEGLQVGGEPHPLHIPFAPPSQPIHNISTPPSQPIHTPPHPLLDPFRSDPRPPLGSACSGVL